MLHHEGLEVLRKQLNAFEDKNIPTVDLFKMAEFILNNNYFEFVLAVKDQISGTAKGTKFAPLSLWITLKKNFFKKEQGQT